MSDGFRTRVGVAPSATPVVIAREGHYLANPTVAELGRCAGLEAPIDPSEPHDLIVVGAGAMAVGFGHASLDAGAPVTSAPTPAT